MSMAGLNKDTPIPTRFVLHGASRVLEVEFDNGKVFRLPFEHMRVHSPSAEVRGHGVGQEVLQVGKRDVTIVQLVPVGNYGVQPTFSDGHSTGIYSWDILYDLGDNHDALWQAYLAQLEAAGASRDPADAGGAAAPAGHDHEHGHACGHDHGHSPAAPSEPAITEVRRGTRQ
jgi:DUF971 family protein